MIDVKTEPDCIVIDAEIGAPRDTVWRVLIEEERIAKWWGDHISFDACLGGHLTERWTDAEGREVLTTGEVVRLDAPRVLELAWADDDWDKPTRVLFRLKEAADATRLMLTHSGWEAFSSSSRERLIREHASGWTRHMTNLAAYVAQMTR